MRQDQGNLLRELTRPWKALPHKSDPLLRRNPIKSRQQNQNKPTPFLNKFQEPGYLTGNLSEHKNVVGNAGAGNTQKLEETFFQQ